MKTETDEERFKRLDAMRGPAKTVNYSSLYGVGAKKLAREAGLKVHEAEALLEAFWSLNWSIQKVAKDSYVKTLKDGSMWIKNPVSGFYYNLRNDRDRWSTLNQGTGVYIFDSWVMRMRRKGIHPQLQYHDEVLLSIPKGKEEEVEELLKEAMKEVNDTLKLNVEIGVDVQFGGSYGDVH
jgi:DNA polymerase I-like protein with 3'-5' exonuclease and polymerase domains